MTLAAPGAHLDAPDRGHETGCLCAARSTADDPFGGAGQRIAPHGHRRRAGMVGGAGERERQRGSVRRCGSRRRAAARARRAPAPARCGTRDSRSRRRPTRRLGDASRIEAVVANRVGHRAGRCASRRSSESRVERAGQRAAADERHAEANAFLLGEADDLDRKGQAPAAQRSTSATPSITPSMPSKAPACGTVSRCEPMKRRAAPLDGAWIDAAQVAGVRRRDVMPAARHPLPSGARARRASAARGTCAS